MFYVLGQNFKIFLYFLTGFLGLSFVTFFPLFFPELSIVVWLFKILIAFLLVWRWSKKIKNQSEPKFFKPSFICMGVYWTIIIANIVWGNEIGGSAIFLIGMAMIAGIILGAKAINDSWTAIKKYDPRIKMNTEVHSVDDYFEIFSRAENLEMELSKLKKEAPPAVVETIMQREAGKLIPFFHLEMIYISLLMLWDTPWMS